MLLPIRFASKLCTIKYISILSCVPILWQHIFSENLREGVSLSRRTIQEGLSKISAIDDGINYGYSDLFMQVT